MKMVRIFSPPEKEDSKNRILLPLHIGCLIVFILVFLLGASAGATKSGKKGGAGSGIEGRIIDRQCQLASCFKKTVRTRTRYIIVHTSEAGLESTLHTVTGGKFFRGIRLTTGGHAHYVIARDGVVYRTLDPKFVANHAGKSIWNGEENLSQCSVGIELVAYHYGTITSQQYASLALLLKSLQKRYSIPDRNVLTHSQIAYSGPNLWHPYDHRGRKRCAKNFERHKAGLKDQWTYDPDVRAGRVKPDLQLAAIFYGKEATALASLPETERATISDGGAQAVAEASSNIISKINTAWRIAGEDYNAVDTVYELPDGRTIRGDQIEKVLGWNRIPVGTVVLLNQETEPDLGPIKTLKEGCTAWSLAGAEYQKPSTKYFLPDGRIMPGNRVTDWDNLPAGTRMITGYRGPYGIRKNYTAKHIAGKAYNKPETLYYLRDFTIKKGDEIQDFNKLPAGTYVFVKLD
jgi:N-acetylmuramoyl-L-alanine amidase